MESPSPQESDFLRQAQRSQCAAVDVRTAAGQKLNPPSLSFFSLFPLYLSLFCFGKFEIETRQPGKPKGPSRSRSRRSRWIEVKISESRILIFFESFSFRLVFKKNFATKNLHFCRSIFTLRNMYIFPVASPSHNHLFPPLGGVVV